MARPPAPAPPLPLLLLLLLLWAALGSAQWFGGDNCTVGRPSYVLCPLSQSTVEYELRWSHNWQWFSVQTGDAAAVSVGLVVQRGDSQQFPRTGLAVMEKSVSTYGPYDVDVHRTSLGCYNRPYCDSRLPTYFAETYDPHADTYDPNPVTANYYNHIHHGYNYHLWPVNPVHKYISEPLNGTRPTTDWKVITLGIDPSAPRDEPYNVHIPLGEVLIGIRCQENNWTSPNYPGCRMSLTATLLPFNVSNNLTVTSPMAPGDVHMYRARDIGDYDTINVSISRDVYNTSRESPYSGLVGAAMLAHRERWSRPTPITFPFNLSGAPPGVVFESYPDETAAMQDYALNLMNNDAGLLNLAGCADSRIGCREPYVPVGASEAPRGVPDCAPCDV